MASSAFLPMSAMGVRLNPAVLGELGSDVHTNRSEADISSGTSVCRRASAAGAV